MRNITARFRFHDTCGRNIKKTPNWRPAKIGMQYLLSIPFDYILLNACIEFIDFFLQFDSLV